MGQILQELKVKTKKGADFPNTEDLLLFNRMRIMNIRLMVYKCDHLSFLILQAHAV
jgi:hypothetical protein